MELRNKTIVFVATVGWQRNWQRQQEWAKRLALHNRVLYVAPYGMTSMGPLTVLKKFKAEKGFTYEHNLPEQAQKNLEHMRLVFVPIRNNGPLNAINARWIQRQLSKHGVRDGADTLFWVCNPADTTVAMLKRYPRSHVLFDIAMRFSLLPDAPPWIKKSQAELARRADVIMYDARAHLTDLPTETHYKATYVPQGFAREVLLKRPEQTARVASIPHPRAVYIGLNTVLDDKLLKQLIERIPELHLVMIGDITPRPFEHPRVHWMGPVNVAHKDAYMVGADVALIPYQVTEYTAGTFPTKFFEYRALGLPVVSTALPELKQFVPQLQIASTAEQFIASVKTILAEQTTARTWGQKVTIPHDFLVKHSWDERFKLVQTVVEQL